MPGCHRLVKPSFALYGPRLSTTPPSRPRRKRSSRPVSGQPSHGSVRRQRAATLSHAGLLHVERAIYKVDSLQSTRSARLPWHTQDRRCEAVVAETVASIRNLHEQCGLGRADWQCGPRSVVLVIPFFGTKSNSYSIILTIIELCWPRFEALTRPFVNWQDSC